jgi:ABC-type glycerol-3-phosphate transport system permease component
MFVIILGMSLLPLQIIMIPLFVIVKQLGWINTYQGLIIPISINAFAVFFMRQFITSIPNEYIDAARVDGSGELNIFFQIVVPMVKPALATLALLAALASWDEFLWPLIVISDQDLATLPLGISYLKSLYQAPAHWLLAVSVVMALPLLLIFLFAQQRIIESAAQTGIKG